MANYKHLDLEGYWLLVNLDELFEEPTPAPKVEAERKDDQHSMK